MKASHADTVRVGNVLTTDLNAAGLHSLGAHPPPPAVELDGHNQGSTGGQNQPSN